MPSVTVTLDDTSPLIQYAGNWRAGNSAGKDSATPKYYGKTFTLTTDNTATASLRWHGAGEVTVYGAKRFNHGDYRVVLDGKESKASGYARSPELFQETLFRDSVNAGEHLLLINDEGTSAAPYLDIDKIDLTTEVGEKTLVLDIRDKAFVFQEKWTDQDIGRYTGVDGASVTLSFSGNALDVFGLVANTVGAYTVSLDGGAPEAYTAYNANHRQTGQILYMARGLDDGPHTVKITNTPDRKDSRLSIARATVYGASPSVGDLIAAPNPNGNTSNGDPSSTPAGNGQLPSSSSGGGPLETPANANANLPGDGDKDAPTGVIVGAVFACCLLVLLGLFIFIFLRRRRELRRQQRYAQMVYPADLGTSSYPGGGLSTPRTSTYPTSLDMQSVRSGSGAGGSVVVLPLGSPTASEGFNTMMTGSSASAMAAQMFGAQQRTQYGDHQTRVNASVAALGPAPSEPRSSVYDGVAYDGCLTVESQPSSQNYSTEAQPRASFRSAPSPFMTQPSQALFVPSRDEKRPFSDVESTGSYVSSVRHEVDAGPAEDVLPPTYDSVHRQR